MIREEQKELAYQLGVRNAWRAKYALTHRATEAASDPIPGGGRHPKSTTGNWMKLLEENSVAFEHVQDAEYEIEQLADKARNDHTNTSEETLLEFLGYDYMVKTEFNERVYVPDPVEGGRFPVMPYYAAGRYVEGRGARISRSISGFANNDVLFRAGFDPRIFARHDGSLGLCPPMVWQLDTGEWIGVDHCGIGYGGTGCDFAQTALREAGVGESDAVRIVTHRFCDVTGLDTDTPVWETSVVWPVEPRVAAGLGPDRQVVLHVGDNGEHLYGDYGRQDPDTTGFYPSTHQTDPVSAWHEFLDQDQDTLPSWARGERTALVILDGSTAEKLGYVLSDNEPYFGRKPFPQIVITQGNVEIWGCFRPADKLRPLDPQVKDIAAKAGFDGAVPYAQGEPLSFLERVGSTFKPDKAHTGYFYLPLG